MPMPRSIRALLPALAATAAGVLAACDGKPAAPAPAAGSSAASTPAGAPAATDARRTLLHLQLNWVPEPEFGGFFAAQQDGLFAKEGLEVELIKGGSGTPTAQMAAGGKVEFAITSADQVLTLNEKGGDLVAVFSVFDSSPMGIMVKADAPWKDLGELWKGDATIAIESGLPYVKYLNRTYPGGHVKIVPTGSGLAAFERGAVQAQQCFISAEPVQMELKKVPVRVFSMAASGYDPYAAVVATSGAWLSSHRDEATRLVRAMREGWVRYQADAAKYNPGIAKLNPAMSLEAMNVAASKQHDLVSPPGKPAADVGTMTAERWQTSVRQLMELGNLAKAPAKVEDLFWNAPR
jgi:NitT/TauT family transport system substrate-binding protein